MTRNSVMRPAKASAIVFHTNAASGAGVGRNRRDVAASGHRLERPLGGRGHVVGDRVEQSG
jgi:hypothetical protein